MLRFKLAPRFAPALVSLGLAGVLAAPAGADVLYSYDDGSMNTAVGPPSSFPEDPETGWGNYFFAQPGGEVIHTVRIAFGPTWPSHPSPVNVYLFNDPDDDLDPRNAVLLASTTLTPAVIGGSVFNDFPITPTEVSGGFFVLATTYTARGQDRPAALDTSGPIDRSWLIYNPATQGVNVNNLAANAYIQPAHMATPINGVWMIRAVGSPIPEPGALSLLGAGGLLLASRRRRA